MGQLHAGRADPNDSLAVFPEYAASDTWTVVHIGQFAGVLLISIALVALGRSLALELGSTPALALVGSLAAVLVSGVFAVQMAVDGVVLKHAIDAWTNASGPDKAVAFRVAEAVRWTEKGLSAFFHLLNGTALLAFGLSVALGRRYARWLGWIGAAAGIGFLIGGVVTAQTGFSPTAGTVLAPSLLAATVFLLGTAWSMWRLAGHADRLAAAGAAPSGPSEAINP